MEANSEKNQSLFPARFLFSTTREQMTALDTLTNSIHGADRLSVARAALSVGLAFIEVTGVAPLTSKAAKEAAKEMAEDKSNTYRIPVDALAELAPVAGAVNGQAH